MGSNSIHTKRHGFDGSAFYGPKEEEDVNMILFQGERFQSTLREFVDRHQLLLYCESNCCTAQSIFSRYYITIPSQYLIDLTYSLG
jgi:hypothetical protein